jgi:predicted Rossmann fold nucleotide-binding protein DprA/Smf involved in DNA uptake
VKLAVVGSRQGADLEHVKEFLRGLYELQPNTVLVSGGANGVDQTAEQAWRESGGRVLSFRPKKLDDENYGIEVWELDDRPRVYLYEGYPTGRTYKDAAFLRDILIAETCDRLVAFYKRGRSWGAGFTEGWAHDMGRPTFAYEAA